MTVAIVRVQLVLPMNADFVHIYNSVFNRAVTNIHFVFNWLCLLDFSRLAPSTPTDMI